LGALAAEDIEISAVRVAFEGQRVHAAAHIGVATRDPHPYARRNGEHRRCPSVSAATAGFSVASSTGPVIRI